MFEVSDSKFGINSDPILLPNSIIAPSSISSIVEAFKKIDFSFDLSNFRFETTLRICD